VHISALEFANYRSFRQPVTMQFDRRMNVIVGPNDSGKTSLLTMIGELIHPSPFRPIDPATHDATIDPAPSRRLHVHVDIDTLQKEFRTAPTLTFAVRDNQQTVEESIMRVVQAAGHSGGVVMVQNGLANREAWQPPDALSGRQSRTWTRSGSAFIAESHTQTTTVQALAARYVNRVYRFDAERIKMHTSSVGAEELFPNGSNLPQALLRIQADIALMAELNRTIQYVLPHIHGVTVIPQGQHLVAHVWPCPPRANGLALARRLEQCGTGVSQVICILALVLGSPDSRTILLDEPSSFLHPVAVRKLIEVAKSFSSHQYIIATHDPLAVDTAGARVVVGLHQDNGESKAIVATTASGGAGIQSVLSEIGAELGDVFGLDMVLFVEGETERRCFRLILEELGGKILGGLRILPLRSTADVAGKHRRAIVPIYQRLASAHAVFPTRISFLLDRECRNEAEVEDIRRQLGGQADFLPVRMYENYLLRSGAVVALLRHLGAADPQVPNLESLPATEDAATLLARLVASETDARHEYDKVVHGLWLTHWLINNDPAVLAPVLEKLCGLARGVSGALLDRAPSRGS
jgi:energy-coupling factor transporter ATP-binding protein EcfA2